jgi:hypothetical protein
MALVPRIPVRALPPATGQAPQNMVGIGYMANNSFGFPGTPFVIGALGSATTDPIWVPGFDSFMLIVDATGGGGSTIDARYQILDPDTQALLVERTIVAGVALPAVSLWTFGASSTTAPAATRGDTFLMMAIRLTASAAGFPVTVNAVRLWCGVR